MDNLRILWSPTGQFIFHLSLSLFVIVYYSLGIFIRLYEKRNNLDCSFSYKSFKKSIGYYYLLAETFFVLLNLHRGNLTPISLVIQIIGCIVILTAMFFLRFDVN